LEKPPKGEQDDEYTFSSADIGVSNGPLLLDVTISIPANKLTICTGVVGCGKSTLLLALAGEMYLTRGTLIRRLPQARTAYCAQDSFLQVDLTIRANICFLSPYEPEWYLRCVRACALDVDFEIMDDGDDQLCKQLSGGVSDNLVYITNTLIQCRSKSKSNVSAFVEHCTLGQKCTYWMMFYQL